ncbi:MAG: AraC family transcriptional regulator [Chitinophagaceae bacterium]|nr:MAG: AraC family transcriptional regulator [Chitinophagaceae bacterium]
MMPVLPRIPWKTGSGKKTLRLSLHKPGFMKVSVTESFLVTGISIRTSNAPGKAENDIPALWTRFWSEGILNQLADRVNDAIYSVYTNYQSDHTGEYDVILGCRANAASGSSAGMLRSVRIEAGPFEQFTAEGDLMQGIVFNEWVKVWNARLDRAFTADFEVYDERATDSANAVVDLFIAVRS